MAGKRQQVADYAKHPPKLCAIAGCHNDARVRVRRRRWAQDGKRIKPKAHGPWLEVCYADSDKLVHEENQQVCELMGLTTPESQRAFLAGKGIIKPMREPGQDEEEARVA